MPVGLPAGSSRRPISVSRRRSGRPTRDPKDVSSSARWPVLRGADCMARTASRERLTPVGRIEPEPEPTSTQQDQRSEDARRVRSRARSCPRQTSTLVTARSQKMPMMKRTEAVMSIERAERGGVERAKVAGPRDHGDHDEHHRQQRDDHGREPAFGGEHAVPGGAAVRAPAGWRRPCRAPRRGCRRRRAGCVRPSRPSGSHASACGPRRCPGRPRAGRRAGSRQGRGRARRRSAGCPRARPCRRPEAWSTRRTGCPRSAGGCRAAARRTPSGAATGAM